MKEDQSEYVKCSVQIWKRALPKQLTHKILPVIVKLMIMEYSELLTDKKFITTKMVPKLGKVGPLNDREREEDI